jgi:hypothetical protein
MAPRKQMSSSQKRDKRKCDAQLVESQRNALHKFFVGSSNVDVNEVEDFKGMNLIMVNMNPIMSACI